MKYAADVILAPVITEASMSRIADKRYTFKVRRTLPSGDRKGC